MNTSFEELKEITDAVYSGVKVSNFHTKIVRILQKHNISIRQKDGKDPIVTISHPKTIANSMIVGLRYTKNDGTKTEDHFLFQPRLPIEKCYGKKLEKLCPEYEKSHKLQR